MTHTFCRHCERPIVNEGGNWIDPEATDDDHIWSETCDSHDTFMAEHEPAVSRSIDREYTGRTFWHEGLCYLVTRETVNAAYPTVTSMDLRHTLTLTWEEVATKFGDQLALDKSESAG